MKYAKSINLCKKIQVIPARQPTCTMHYWTVATSAHWAKAAQTLTFAWSTGI